MVTLAQKQERVVQLKESLDGAQMALVSDFKGLSVKEMTALRRRLQEAGGEYTVAKNSLIKRALKETGLPELDGMLKGTNVLLIGKEDPVAPVKALVDFLKETKKELEIKGGILEGKVVSAEEFDQIAKLPSREEMIAKLMGSMQSPARGVAVTLSGVARNMVHVLEAVRKQKEENA